MQKAYRNIFFTPGETINITQTKSSQKYSIEQKAEK